MNIHRPLASFTVSTALVAAAAAVVIAGTAPANAKPATPAAGAAERASAGQLLRQLDADLSGVYTLADGRSLRVWRAGVEMRAQLDDGPVWPLGADGPDRLRTADGRTTLQFRTAPHGRAYAVSLGSPR